MYVLELSLNLNAGISVERKMNLPAPSELAQYTFLWLANAMSLPAAYYMERYYYDSRDKTFFLSAKSNDDPYTLYYDKFNNELDIMNAVDLSIRLKSIDDPSSDIIEIPRLTVNEKIGIQMEFVSKLLDTHLHNNLIAAIEQQQDYKFVLDTVLGENNNFEPMADFWNDYKSTVAFTYISKFIKVSDSGFIN